MKFFAKQHFVENNVVMLTKSGQKLSLINKNFERSLAVKGTPKNITHSAKLCPKRSH
jgi:hypothetical protein